MKLIQYIMEYIMEFLDILLELISHFVHYRSLIKGLIYFPQSPSWNQRFQGLYPRSNFVLMRTKLFFFKNVKNIQIEF